MAVANPNERSLSQLVQMMDEEAEVEVASPEDILIEDELGDSFMVELPDGGVEIDMNPEMDVEENVPHGANLADYMDESELRSIASDLVSMVEADRKSREEWETTYTKGMDNLGLKVSDRSEPWPGASAAYHPMLLEAIVRFQAQTIGEIFPARGPVKTSIVGTATLDKEKQAKRVQGYMNYVILNEMREYRPETEKLLFSLALAGSAFRKLYKDNALNRPVSMFIPAEDIIVNYSAFDIRTAERVTHRIKMAPNELRKLQVSGFYSDIELQDPVSSEDQIAEKVSELTGRKETTEKDTRHTIYEVHTDWDLPGFEDPMGIALPYVITIDKYSRQVLAIRRNWKEGDESMAKRNHFVHYEYVPGFGFYGFGLTHLIGGLAAASTSLMRQLIDAGTLANLPGGLKTRGLRMKNDDTPILPGEWRDVDVPSGAIRDNLFPIPYKEPSPTLFSLFGVVVEDGRRFASMADLKVADMNQEAPVGTTLAIMERAMKVQSAIQARIHAGLKEEFRMLAEIIATQTDPAYPYEVAEGQQIKAADFDERVDIIPVSDPNAATMAQRIMQYQAIIQLSTMAPQIYDQKALHRQIVEVLGVANAERIVPMQAEIPPMDPITENSNILNMSPVQAKEYQDHDAHLRVHGLLLQDPRIAQQLQNSQSGPAVSAAVDAHIREHLAFLYRREVEQELGVPMPPMGQPVPEDVEKRLSVLVAEAAELLTGKKQAMAQAEKNAAMQQDPVIQQKEKELQIRMAEVERKKLADQTDAQLEARKLEIEREIEMRKLEQKSEEVGIEAAVKLAVADKKSELDAIKAGADIAKSLDDVDLKRKQIGSKENNK